MTADLGQHDDKKEEKETLGLSLSEEDKIFNGRNERERAQEIRMYGKSVCNIYCTLFFFLRRNEIENDTSDDDDDDDEFLIFVPMF
ncbi:unnamed protein product [Caenorhabditis nigoni]